MGIINGETVHFGRGCVMGSEFCNERESTMTDREQCGQRGCKQAVAEGRDYCPEHALIHDNCSYMDAAGKSIPCGKLTEAGYTLCPKHVVMAEGWKGDMDRKMEKARRAKERIKTMRDALVDSPLRAENPDFEKRNRYA